MMPAPTGPNPPRELTVVTHSCPAGGASPSTDPLLYVSSRFHTRGAEPDITAVGSGSGFISAMRDIPPEADVVVLSEHPDVDPVLLQRAAGRGQLVVAPIGRPPGAGHEIRNSVLVAFPGEAELVRLDKFSFAAAEPGIPPGSALHVFELPWGRACVLNCFEYTHADIIAELLKLQIDLVIVTSRNRSWQLYDEYAVADVHRLSCIVVLNNVADYGGVGVYAPSAVYGTSRKHGVFQGGTLFAARGPHETDGIVRLPLKWLREHRTGYEHVAPNEKKDTSGPIRHIDIDPPEHVKFPPPNSPPYFEALNNPRLVDRVDLEAIGYVPTRDKPLGVAIAQLRSISKEEYVATDYHISASPECDSFERMIESHLTRLEASFGTEHHNRSAPDLLVFPEVFVPLGFEPRLKEFALKHNTIVVAGIEYDPIANRELVVPTVGSDPAYVGSNRCRVYVPNRDGVTTCDYTKLTMSQYDAVARQGNEYSNAPRGHFPLTRGTQLKRFQAGEHFSFGVLICYDLSHADIVQAINTRSVNGSEADPLDLLIVVAHNPYADLYRKCALADCHRYYQYLVLCNVAPYGGSGVFGPMRTRGQRRTLMSAGVGTEGIFQTEVNITDLRLARTDETKIREQYQNTPGLFRERLKFNRTPVEPPKS